jgi:multicomponent Na+:H+ antiporter subunit B
MDGKKDIKGMTLVVKTIARLITGLILLFGIYIVLHGHLSPGGGFAGGVLIAGCFILLFLAFGSEETKSEMKKWRACLGESLGILMFWLISMLGIFAGTHFFLNLLGKGKPFDLFSAGIIPLCNIGIGIEVGSALFAIFITLAVLRMEKRK